MTLLRYLRSRLIELPALALRPMPPRSVMCSCDEFCFCDRCQWRLARSRKLRKYQRASLGDNRPRIVRFLVPFIAFYLFVFFSSCTTVHPVAATGEVDGGKRGTATVVKVCGFVLSGDGSTATAAHNGAVRFVQTVDVRRTSVLGLVTWSTTIVTGE